MSGMDLILKVLLGCFVASCVCSESEFPPFFTYEIERPEIYHQIHIKPSVPYSLANNRRHWPKCDRNILNGTYTVENAVYCDQFFLCDKGSIYLFQCDDGYGYAPYSGCKLLHTVDCSKRPNLQKPLGTGLCHRRNEISADLKGCGRFITCENNQATRGRCPPQQSFDDITKVCRTQTRDEQKKCDPGVQIAYPIRPNRPNRPLQPAQIVQTAQPYRPPAQTYQPLQPVQTVQTIQTAQTYQPVQPVQSVQSAQNYQPVQPVQSVQSAQNYQSVQPVQSVQSTQNYQSVQPVQTVQSAQNYQPVAQPGQPYQTAEPVIQAARPFSAVEPVQPIQPIQTAVQAVPAVNPLPAPEVVETSAVTTRIPPASQVVYYPTTEAPLVVAPFGPQGSLVPQDVQGNLPYSGPVNSPESQSPTRPVYSESNGATHSHGDAHLPLGCPTTGPCDPALSNFRCPHEEVLPFGDHARYPYFNSCRKFIICYRDHSYRVAGCETGQAFDRATRVCVAQQFVNGCGGKPAFAPSVPEIYQQPAQYQQLGVPSPVSVIYNYGSGPNTRASAGRQYELPEKTVWGEEAQPEDSDDDEE